MAGIGASIIDGLTVSSEGGYKLLKNVQDTIKQNLKMLILTNPGERFDTNYGVGIYSFLFEGFNPSVFSKIEQDIRDQVGIYLPSVNIKGVLFDTSLQDSNQLRIKIEFTVPSIAYRDVLVLSPGSGMPVL